MLVTIAKKKTVENAETAKTSENNKYLGTNFI